MLPKLSWPQVTLFLGMFAITIAGACTLLGLGKSIADLVSLVALIGVPILTAAGAAVYQKLDHVKEISNGNLSEMRDMVKSQQDQLTRLALKLPAETNPDILNPPADATQEFTTWPR